MATALVWFRNDLRLHDNETLHKAAQFDEVIPVYVFDPRQFSTTSFGFPKTGPHRTRFLLETVDHLRESLRDIGSELVIRHGTCEEELPETGCSSISVDTVFAQKEITAEEIAVEQAVEASLQADLQFIWGHTLLHRDDIPYEPGGIPKVFTNFRKQCEKKANCWRMLPHAAVTAAKSRRRGRAVYPQPVIWG
ncbi:MAG: deoxyribodipyrimidine photo-lyase [Fodinibius sp.]|nr:deoxyribodipyrimidine photo-lyase [Fodinibius sp.]